MSLVQIENVSKVYTLGEQQVQALGDITLSVEEGEYLAIAGPSGSGKSTLLNLIGCIDTPSRGKILINGHDVGGRTANQLADLRARTIGFIFQTFNLLPVLTAAENVEYPLLQIKELSATGAEQSCQEISRHSRPGQIRAPSSERTQRRTAPASGDSPRFGDAAENNTCR